MSIFNKVKNIKGYQFYIGVLAVFLISFAIYLINFPGFRYKFIFPEAGCDTDIVEIRTLHKDRQRTKIQMYTEELLAGTTVQRAVPVFPVGTKVLSCFEKNKTVYINLSEEALTDFYTGMTILQKTEYLEKNIKNNFSYIKKIELFIDGNQVKFEDKIK